jgi:cell shape-determining protein MreC
MRFLTDKLKAKKPRKTIQVVLIKDRINELLNSDYTQEEKMILCNLLTEILIATKNYGGYNNRYWIDKGFRQWIEDGQPEGKNKVASDKYFGPEFDRFYY